MIPTAHLRWYTDALHKPPVLQQLWAPAEMKPWAWDLSTLPYLIGESKGEWRDVQTVYAMPQSKTSPAPAATGHDGAK